MIALAGWLVALAMAGCLIRLRSVLARRMELAARACHELRRPLAAARLGVELVAREAPSGDGTLRAIDLELASAGMAVEDLGAALFGAHGPSRTGLVDIPSLLAESAEAFAPLARARGVELDLRWQGEPAALAGDRLRLAQATSNLIVNAIEHGRGRVKLRGTAGAGRVEIAVADEGPGLPAPVRELARGRTRNARRRRRRGRGRDRGRGHGHGLAVVADVAERHGGELIASPTGASELTLSLPLRRD